jgi:hypothetical protein
VCPADADVMELGSVAQGDGARGVDLVAVHLGRGGDALTCEDRGRLVAFVIEREGRTTMGLVGADLVVVPGEEINATLEPVERGELVAPSQPLLEGLVITLDPAFTVAGASSYPQATTPAPGRPQEQPVHPPSVVSSLSSLSGSSRSPDRRRQTGDLVWRHGVSHSFHFASPTARTDGLSAPGLPRRPGRAADYRTFDLITIRPFRRYGGGPFQPA